MDDSLVAHGGAPLHATDDSPILTAYDRLCDALGRLMEVICPHDVAIRYRVGARQEPLFYWASLEGWSLQPIESISLTGHKSLAMRGPLSAAQQAAAVFQDALDAAHSTPPYVAQVLGEAFLYARWDRACDTTTSLHPTPKSARHAAVPFPMDGVGDATYSPTIVYGPRGHAYRVSTTTNRPGLLVKWDTKEGVDNPLDGPIDDPDDHIHFMDAGLSRSLLAQALQACKTGQDPSTGQEVRLMENDGHSLLGRFYTEPRAVAALAPLLSPSGFSLDKKAQRDTTTCFYPYGTDNLLPCWPTGAPRVWPMPYDWALGMVERWAFNTPEADPRPFLAVDPVTFEDHRPLHAAITAHETDPCPLDGDVERAFQAWIAHAMSPLPQKLRLLVASSDVMQPPTAFWSSKALDESGQEKSGIPQGSYRKPPVAVQAFLDTNAALWADFLATVPASSLWKLYKITVALRPDDEEGRPQMECHLLCTEGWPDLFESHMNGKALLLPRFQAPQTPGEAAILDAQRRLFGQWVAPRSGQLYCVSHGDDVGASMVIRAPTAQDAWITANLLIPSSHRTVVPGQPAPVWSVRNMRLLSDPL